MKTGLFFAALPNDYDDPDDHALGRPGGFSVFLSALSLFSRPHPPPHSSLLQSITLEIHIYVYTFTHLMCGQWRKKHIFIYIFFRTLLFLLGSDTPLAVAKYLVYATRARHVSYCCRRYLRLPSGNPLCLEGWTAETTEGIWQLETHLPFLLLWFLWGIESTSWTKHPCTLWFPALRLFDLFINTTNMVPCWEL